ncbi:MAG: hypothetical protein QOE45_2826 [Frankiaceae bacterium]|nr:hypothetical protein [Frankiaceae bacterium]
MADWDGLRRGLEGAVTPPPLDALRARRRHRKQRRTIAVTCALALVGTASGMALLGQRDRDTSSGVVAKSTAINRVVHNERYTPPRADHDYIVTDFDFVGADTGWALGLRCVEDGCTTATWRTDDGGSTWGPEVVVARGVPRSSYTEQDPAGGGARSIRMVDAEEGFAFNPDLYVTHDGARTWTRVPQPSKVAGIQVAGRSVWVTERGCPVEDDCDVVVRTATLGRRPFAVADLLMPATIGSTLVRRAGERHGYLLTFDAAGGSPATLHRTADGGATWQPATNPCPDAVSAALSAGAGRPLLLVCSGEVDAEDRTLHRVPKQAFTSADRGTTWRALPAPPEAGELTDLTSVSATTAYATTLVPARLLVTTDGGATWEQAEGTAKSGYGYSNIDVSDARHAWAMGDQGVLWRTTDGTTWERLALPPDAAPATSTPPALATSRVPAAPADKDVRWTGLSFYDAAHGYAVGERCVAKTCRAVLRATGDGGRTWRVAPGPPGTWQTDEGRSANGVRSVTFADARNGWLYGDALVETHDGGLHWQNVGGYTGDVVARDGVVWALHYEGCASMFCGAWVGHGATTGGPLTGEAGADLVEHGSLAAVDATHAYLVDDGTYGGDDPKFRATADGGRTWARYPAPCPRAAWRTLSATAADDLRVLCGDSAAHFVARSRDGGATWRTARTGDEGGATFVAVSPDLAFRAGDRSVRVTRDGGATWRVMPGLDVTSPLQAFVVVDGTHAFALYEGGLLYGMSDGASWERLTRP